MFYVKYGGTWLSESEEIDMWKDMDGHLNRETDREKDRKIENKQQVFIKA